MQSLLEREREGRERDRDGEKRERDREMAGWSGAAESDLKAAGAEALPDGRTGVRLKGWHIESFNGPILNSSAVQQYALLVLSRISSSLGELKGLEY